MSKATLRVKLIVDGMVQGVGFRATTQRVAGEIGLVGYVCNLPDGRVQIVAEGAQGQLDELVAYARRGPVASSVTDVEEEWGRATGEFSAFRITYW